MVLRALGTQSPYPRDGCACSGYLIQSNGTSVVLDLGSGTLANLTRHLDVLQIDAIVLTHNHADHSSDTLCLYYALGFSELEPTRQPTVFGPSDWNRRMEAFLLSSAPNPMERVFDVKKLSDTNKAAIGDLSIDWLAVDHGVEAYACRVSDGFTALAYSGDTRRCDNLVQIARNANVFLCEAGATRDEDAKTNGHMTPEDAARVALEAGVDRLILTHLAPGLDPEFAAERAERILGRRVEVAAEERLVHI